IVVQHDQSSRRLVPMAATSTNRSRDVAKRRPKAKGATTKATSATRKATNNVTGRATAATNNVTGRATAATKAKSATRKATKNVAGRATAATKAKSATSKATKKVAGTAKADSIVSRPSDLVALIKADHVALNQLFKRYG